MQIAHTSQPVRVPFLIAQALGLSLLIAAGAQISVPFVPVPMTLQTLAVLAIAGIFGARTGVAAMLAYLAEGALGLPVFATGGGAATLIGPTAGYLGGMVLAAAIVGHTRGRMVAGAGILAATAVIYACGVAWLAFFIGLRPAISAGVVPFLLGDAAKGLLAWALATAIGRRRI